MFITEKRFDIIEQEVVDFMRLVGKVGLKFDISDRLMFVEDCGMGEQRRIYFRRIYVYGTRKELNKLYEMRDILRNYHLH